MEEVLKILNKVRVSDILIVGDEIRLPRHLHKIMFEDHRIPAALLAEAV